MNKYLRHHPLASRKLTLETVEHLEKKSKIKWAPKNHKHVYTYYNYNEGTKKKLWKSVTGLKSIYFSFNSEVISKSLSLKSKNKKYQGKSQVEIMWLWFESAGFGTIVHNKQESHTLFGTIPSEQDVRRTLLKWRIGDAVDISMNKNYYLQCMRTLKLDLFSAKYAVCILKQFNFGLMYKKKMHEDGFEIYTYPFDFEKKFIQKAVEIKIYSEKMGVGGTLDELWYNPKTKVWIVSDWKCTSKKIVKINLKKINSQLHLKKIKDYKDMFSDLQNIVRKPQFWVNKSYIEYALQLSIYHYILKTCYKNNSNFKYKCNEIHIVRLWHEEDGPQVISFRSNLFEDRIRKIEELLNSKK